MSVLTASTSHRVRDVSRRTFFLEVGVFTVGAATAACTSAGSRVPATGRAASATTLGPGARVLLAYFSRAGENYYYGGRRELEVGNTEVVARLIAERLVGDRLRVDTYRVEAADPYPASYDATVARNVREEDQDARPALLTPPPSLSGYDVVLLGSPVWNVRAPMIMYSVVERMDLRGKIVLPFVTHAVSGMGQVSDEYARLAPQAQLGDGLAVQGERAHDAATDVQDWLRAVGLLPRT
jgi:flavodoxin